ELTEPESRNIDWIAANNPNIRFSMNLHSSGNYFMWSPGAYATPGRISAPRPTLAGGSLFWGGAARLRSEIKRGRGGAVRPARAGAPAAGGVLLRGRLGPDPHRDQAVPRDVGDAGPDRPDLGRAVLGGRHLRRHALVQVRDLRLELRGRHVLPAAVGGGPRRVPGVRQRARRADARRLR